MMRQLSKGKLKTGEEMRCILVTPSQDDYRNKILSLLGDYVTGDPWLWHIHQALAGKTQGLETRFYLGLLEGDPICNITTSEYDRVGILGHVYTKPGHRRKGACALLMETQMEDWKRRGGGLMLLTTECHSPPYWIYQHFGFRSVVPGSRLMQCSTDEDFQAKYFSPAPTNAVEVGWAFVLPDGRWPGLNLLDFFVHPSFSDRAPVLLQAIELPPGKSQCYVDAASAHRVEALQAAGFRREGLLRAQFQHQGLPVDIAIYSTSV